MNFSKLLSNIALSLALSLALFGAFGALADSNVPLNAPCDPQSPNYAACISGQGTNNGSGQPITLPNPLSTNDPRVIIGYVIKVVLGLVGSVALVLFMYGGIMMMTSAGNSDRITSGRNTLVWATIGLLIIFASYTLVNLIFFNISSFRTGG